MDPSPLVAELIALSLAHEHGGDFAAALRTAQQALDAARVVGEDAAIAAALVAVARYRHIAGNSAAVNRGVPVGIANAIDGVPRPMGSGPDLGAVESHTGMSIQYDQEHGGDIDLAPPDGVYENSNGAMVWNGAAWIINNTWAHGYFIDQYSRRRLYGHVPLATFTGAGVSAGAPRVTVVQGHTVTEAIYTYSVPTQAGGTFRPQSFLHRLRSQARPRHAVLAPWKDHPVDSC